MRNTSCPRCNQSPCECGIIHVEAIVDKVMAFKHNLLAKVSAIESPSQEPRNPRRSFAMLLTYGDIAFMRSMKIKPTLSTGELQEIRNGR